MAVQMPSKYSFFTPLLLRACCKMTLFGIADCFHVILMYKGPLRSSTCLLHGGNQIGKKVPLTNYILPVILSCFVHVLSFLVGSCATVGHCIMMVLG